MTKRELKFVEFARKYNAINGTVRKNLHISLIVYKNRMLSVGLNNYYKGHSIASKANYKYNASHSEMIALAKFPFRNYDISKATLINVRLAKKDNGILMSAPCAYCYSLIKEFNIKQVIYSTPSGFVYL